jgi:hypothetical protein
MRATRAMSVPTSEAFLQAAKRSEILTPHTHSGRRNSQRFGLLRIKSTQTGSRPFVFHLFLVGRRRQIEIILPVDPPESNFVPMGGRRLTSHS